MPVVTFWSGGTHLLLPDGMTACGLKRGRDDRWRAADLDTVGCGSCRRTVAYQRYRAAA